MIERHEGGTKKWGGGGRKALSPDRLVSWEEVASGQGLPRLVRATVEGVDPVPWAEENRDRLASELAQHGGLLLRGFAVREPADLERLIRSVSSGALDYIERSSPRSTVGGKIFTSTDHPPGESIFLHNEQSYNLRFPLRIFFLCLVPATSGGATPLADCRRVLQRLDPGIRRNFARTGYMYVRNFGGGLGLPWQTAFQTEDRREVERYCEAQGIDFEWLDSGRLRTRQVRPAIVRHPHTGDEVWFNHATFFHLSTLPAKLRGGLETLNEADLPNQTYYGDGSRIEPEVLDALREAYREETVRFVWDRGDLLMLDNMMVAHGRDPYSGPRQVVVGMSEPTRLEASSGLESGQSEEAK